jgi:hypothetical protein
VPVRQPVESTPTTAQPGAASDVGQTRSRDLIDPHGAPAHEPGQAEGANQLAAAPPPPDTANAGGLVRRAAKRGNNRTGQHRPPELRLDRSSTGYATGGMIQASFNAHVQRLDSICFERLPLMDLGLGSPTT